METKLELELRHLKYYLDTGLKGLVNNEKVILIGLDIIAEYWIVWKKLAASNQGCSVSKGFKPIFHPRSDLTKEIEHNGEKFVPDQELQKYVDANNGLLRYKKQDVYDLASCEYWVVEKLSGWHFWLFGDEYFEQGLIIDINSLKSKAGGSKQKATGVPGKYYWITCIKGYEFEGITIKTGEIGQHYINRLIPDGWRKTTQNELKNAWL